MFHVHLLLLFMMAKNHQDGLMKGLNILPGFLLLGCTTAATLLLRKGLLLLSVLLLSLCEVHS